MSTPNDDLEQSLLRSEEIYIETIQSGSGLPWPLMKKMSSPLITAEEIARHVGASGRLRPGEMEAFARHLIEGYVGTGALGIPRGTEVSPLDRTMVEWMNGSAAYDRAVLQMLRAMIAGAEDS